MVLQRWETKIRRKKVRLNRVSNSQPPGYEFDTLTIEPLAQHHDQVLYIQQLFNNQHENTTCYFVDCILNLPGATVRKQHGRSLVRWFTKYWRAVTNICDIGMHVGGHTDNGDVDICPLNIEHSTQQEPEITQYPTLGTQTWNFWGGGGETDKWIRVCQSSFFSVPDFLGFRENNRNLFRAFLSIMKTWPWITPQRLCCLTLSQTRLVLTCLHYKSFENTVWKGEIACNEQFLLFSKCFRIVWKTFCHVHQIWNWNLQTISVWKSLKFVLWKWVKNVKKQPKSFI